MLERHWSLGASQSCEGNGRQFRSCCSSTGGRREGGPGSFWGHREGGLDMGGERNKRRTDRWHRRQKTEFSS